MSTRYVRILGYLFLSVIVCTAQAKEESSRPNIIFILADDLGFNQLGCNGDSPIKTPNLDRLASTGIRFTNAYAGNTVCSPSRVSLFTGRDSRLLRDNSNTVELGKLDVTLAQVLKYAGYDTALFGKYSIGTQMGVTDPLSMGFDTWFGMNSILEGHRQYPHFLWRDNTKIRIQENESGRHGLYAQQAFTKEAIKYIRSKRANPFFVMLAFSSPHAELAAPDQFKQPYKGVFEEEVYLGMSTGEPSDKYAWYYPNRLKDPYATFAGMVSALDHYVAQILETLRELGIEKNTLIFFSSDNGPHEEGGSNPVLFRASHPFRGIKRDLFDGGIRVPMIASWPAMITSARVDHTPWTFADVLPTLAEVAGVDLNVVPRVLTNGNSIAGLLSDQPVTMAERTLYWEFGKQAGDANSGIVGDVYQAARRGKWKAVQYGHDAPCELYDILADPGEATDVSKIYPKIHTEFVVLFEKYRD
ncbi:sulfatase-like hydrolase/transferase [Bythopirellula polymerisocia]|uniref:Arylsulfatase n=1 Tax=Bythopirellula polymerisocia TaxID=2528003 RepID=A0A5C6CYZ5_9BACT|nr:sulfatase-like hydrolase/transferase [Bythopirellula polymerisocia]TWU28707.1 Arylsulfatase [Bythopirellula polymerisocia]